MKYTITSIINLPRNEVVTKFMDPDASEHWMEGYKGMKMIKGEPGEEGAVSMLTFFEGKKEMKMEETIVEKKLPEYIVMSYNTPQMNNVNKHIFIDLGNGKTQIDAEQQFLMKGLMMKLMGIIGKGMFKKQSQKYADAFKAYAELGESVLDT